MANFLLVYHGGSMPESEVQQKQVVDAWNAWFAQLGSAVVDGGNPASQSRTLAADGSVSETSLDAVSGYSIIAAESIDQAVELARGCPVLQGGARVEVVETFDAM